MSQYLIYRADDVLNNTS